MKYAAVYRALDLLFVIPALLLLFPLLVLTGIVVRVFLGSPVIFRQDRIGWNGVIIRIAKYRTMTQERDKNGELLSDAERLTRLGKILRSLSLDELPQLFNVLRGDLSLVGPRPLLVRYLSRYSPEQARRHEVKPGITGWAQVNGRNSLDWNSKFRLDVWYVDHHSPLLYLKILFLTPLRVMFRRGISAQGDATMPEFQGNLRGETLAGSTRID